VICATCRVQTQVWPVTEVARSPGGNAVRGAVGGLSPCRTGECRVVEFAPLDVGQIDARGEGVDAVIPGFIVVIVQQVRLQVVLPFGQ
jgi:hypothetical protein